MKKISFLFPNFFFIGAQRAAAATIRELVQRGWTVSVVFFDVFWGMRNEIPD